MNRQRLILFILVILFGVAAIWSYSAMPRFKTVSSIPDKSPQQKKTAAAVPEKKVSSTDDGTRLNIALLDRPTPEFKGYKRNLFRPIFSDETKIVKQKAVVIKPPQPNVIALPASTVLVQPEAAPLARFTFLGFLKKGSVKTIFLAKGNEILLVKKGDRVAERYAATEISDQSLTLSVVDTGDEIIIPLLENRPLAVVK